MSLAILSTVRRAPLSYFVYSSLSFFGRERGGDLPGTWFVRALAGAGRDVAAIRQTLYRMESDGELVTRKSGRVKFYRASGYADAEIDTGLAKIFNPRDEDWDGRWTMVSLNLRSPAQRTTRERVVALLAVHGFALVGPDLYLHPRDVGQQLVDALATSARPHVIVMRGEQVNELANASIAARWNVQELARRYERTLAHLREVERALDAGVSDSEAFLLRFAVVFDYLGVAWDDPDLPSEVLPSGWPGAEARRLTAHLYERLAPAARRYANLLLEQSLPVTENATS